MGIKLRWACILSILWLAAACDSGPSRLLLAPSPLLWYGIPELLANEGKSFGLNRHVAIRCDHHRTRGPFRTRQSQGPLERR